LELNNQNDCFDNQNHVYLYIQIENMLQIQEKYVHIKLLK
jgi:hypothetical protein